MTQENNKPGMGRNVIQYLLIGAILVIVLLVGFSNLFGSNLSREDLRGTAYVIAAIRLTSDAEARLLPTATRVPRQITPSPRPTLNPEDCPPEEFSAWVEITTADVAQLELEIEYLQTDDYTSNDLIEIQTRALEKESSLLEEDYPLCVSRVQDKLQNLYGHFVAILQSAIDNDLDTLEAQTDAFIIALIDIQRVFTILIERQGDQ